MLIVDLSNVIAAYPADSDFDYKQTVSHLPDQYKTLLGSILVYQSLSVYL